MKLIHRLGRLVGRFSDHFIGWLLLISVLLNLAQVFTRYAINSPLSASAKLLESAAGAVLPVRQRPACMVTTWI